MKKKFLRKIIIMFTALTLVFVQVGAVSFADEKESLEEYLEELKIQIAENNASLDDIYVSIEDVNEQIDANTLSLEAQQQSLATQKASMMKRIQYMYEAGANMDILLALLTSDSISDALNKSSYINEMVTYDREMLDAYIDTLHDIENTQTELETRRSELIELRDNFQSAKTDMNDCLNDAYERLAEFDLEEEEAQALIEETVAEAETVVIPDSVEEALSNDSYDADESEDDEDVSYEESEEDSEIDEDTEEDYYYDDEETEESEEDTSDDESYAEDDTDDGVDYYVPISTYGYSEEEIYDLARVTYLEDGSGYISGTVGGTYRSIYLCACVILNRANNWYGGSITSAIYAAGQYATAYKYTNWGGGTLVINDITWAAVADALSSCDPNPYYQCNGQWLASMGLTEYYRDAYTDEVFYYDY